MENFPEILKGGALELRRLPVTFENAKRVFDIVDRNREHLGRWLTWVDRIKTAEDEYDGLKCVSANEWNYFIFDGERLAGSAGFGDRDEKTKSLEIGYWLDKESTGKGIMTRAVGMLENAAFSAGWNLIRIRCDALNAASQNVPKRLGYVFEGTRRQDHLYNDGTIGDSMWFSKLKSEWEKAAGR